MRHRAEVRAQELLQSFQSLEETYKLLQQRCDEAEQQLEKARETARTATSCAAAEAAARHQKQQQEQRQQPPRPCNSPAPALVAASLGSASSSLSSGSLAAASSCPSAMSTGDAVPAGSVKDRIRHFEKIRAEGVASGSRLQSSESQPLLRSTFSGLARVEVPVIVAHEPTICRVDDGVEYGLSPLERTPERSAAEGRQRRLSERWASCRGG